MRVAARPVEAVIGCRGGQGDGDVLGLFLPLLLDFNRGEKQGRFGHGGGGPVRLFSLRQRGDGGGRRGGRNAAVPVGV